MPGARRAAAGAARVHARLARRELLLYPRELDYVDPRPLDDTWHRIDSSVRETDEDYQVPSELADRPEGSDLVYLSLGSLGGADVGLMQRLIDVSATRATASS